MLQRSVVAEDVGRGRPSADWRMAGYSTNFCALVIDFFWQGDHLSSPETNDAVYPGLNERRNRVAPLSDSTNRLTRRQLLAVSAVGAVNLFPLSVETRDDERVGLPFLRECGFWDYTTPGAGGMEAFQKSAGQQYRSLEEGVETLIPL